MDLEFRYGRLIVVRSEIRTAKNGHRLRYVLTLCDCGSAPKWVLASNIKRGFTRSCGCLAKEFARANGAITGPINGAARRTHGHTVATRKTPTYVSWDQVKQRCTNPNATAFPYYGAKGITICERWHTFAAFLSDLGPRPDGTSLGRYLDTGNYEPGNVAWMTPSEQAAEAHNKRLLLKAGLL